MNIYANTIQLKCKNNIIDKTKKDIDILKHYLDLKLVKSSEYYIEKYYDDNNPYVYYCCFNYVFKNKNIEEVDDAYMKLYREYEVISKQEANIGDIISFHKQDLEDDIPNPMNCEHFAIISDIKDEQIYIRSKWGTMGVFKGRIELLPEIYGNVYQIWKKRNIKNEIGSF